MHGGWFVYLGFKVNVGGRHLGDLEDAHGQRDGTQDEQAVVDQNPGEHGVSDAPVAADKARYISSQTDD